MFVEGKPRTVFFLRPDTLFTAFITTVEKNHNIRAWRTWSWVSSELEDVKWLLQPCLKGQCNLFTLSKKHCGRKDNLGRLVANCNFSEPNADTVSPLISIGLLEKDACEIQRRFFRVDLPREVHQPQDLVHWRQFVLDLAIVGQSTRQGSLRCTLRFLSKRFDQIVKYE